MSRADIDAILGRVAVLAEEINVFVPVSPGSTQFRADLAGLLVVSIAASYEACVKETMVNFSSQHHNKFGIFAQNHFNKLNSRINMNDLYGYTKTFDSSIHKKFVDRINSRKQRLITRIGQDFTKSYSQILSWRHDFAHAGIRNTTVNEAILIHRLAKRVLYSFDDAFN